MVRKLMILVICVFMITGSAVIMGCGGGDKPSEKKEQATKKPAETAAKPTAKPTPKPTAKPTEKPIEKVDAKVTEVIDGDSIKVTIGTKTETIQLIGAVAPKDGECFFKEATAHAKKFLLNKSVKVGKDENLPDRDGQGNLLRYVWFQKGEMLFNEVAIEFGYALMTDKKHAYQADFEKAQKRAKEKQQGLWATDTCGGKLQPADAQGRALKPPVEGCEEKKTCTKMAGCEEAYFHLSACGNVTLDRDGNGVPCEAICKEETAKFSCEPKKTCTKMESCVEAYYHLVVCKNTALDQNNDGIPCAALCVKKE